MQISSSHNVELTKFEKNRLKKNERYISNYSIAQV